MLQKHGTMLVSFRRYFGLMAFAAAVMLVVGNAAWADGGQKVKTEPAVRLLTTIPVPVIPAVAAATAGALYSFDISWVDQRTQLYYLADRSNQVVDVADAKTSTFVK
jgi:hypothetical protein